MLKFFKQRSGSIEEQEEYQKFVRLGAIIGAIIGIYWIIVPTKEVVFFNTVGAAYLPYAKVFSVLFLVPVLYFYSKLLDRCARQNVFYSMCAFYGIGALLFSFFIMHQEYGLANTALSWTRMLGWLWYGFVESFGVLMATYFWSFASDVSTPESAKKGFTILALGAQLGGFIGPVVMYYVAFLCGPGPIIGMTSIGMVFIALLMAHFMRVTPQKTLEGFHGYAHHKKEFHVKKTKVGFFEGLRLIITQPYLRGIASIGMIWALVSTVLEFYFKMQASTIYTQVNDLNQFFFMFAICMNAVSLGAILCGIGAFGRALGLRKTLFFFPLLVLIAVFVVGISPTLFVSFMVLIVTKGLNYVLHDPLKEQLYIPTSRETKYKAKAWIDTFGFRGAKCVGSAVHMLRPMLQSSFVGVSSLICSLLIVGWMRAAWYVGKCHAKAIENDEQIC
ncbi:hypothetical protein EBU24_03075 [bacterium]|nr:hypothetical protein [bacterium]